MRSVEFILSIACLFSASAPRLEAASPMQVEHWLEPTLGIEYPTLKSECLAGTRGVLFEQGLAEFQGDESLWLTARDTDTGAVLWRFEDLIGVSSRGLATRESDGALFSLAGRYETGGPDAALLRRFDAETGKVLLKAKLPYASGGTGTMLELSADGGTLIVMVPANSAARILAYDPEDLSLRWEALVGLGNDASVASMGVSGDGRVVAVAGTALDDNDAVNVDLVWGCVDGATASPVWSKRDVSFASDGFADDVAVAMVRDEEGEVKYRVHTAEGWTGNAYYIQDGLEDRTIAVRTINGNVDFLVDDALGIVAHAGPSGQSLVVRSGATGERLGARGVPDGASVRWLQDGANSVAFGYGTQESPFGAGPEAGVGLIQDLGTGQLSGSSIDLKAAGSVQRAAIIGPAASGEVRYAVATRDYYNPALFGFTYRIRGAGGQLGAQFEQNVPLAAPAATVALSPTPTAGGWCALLVSQPASGYGELPDTIEASRLQRLRHFDPATGTVLAELDLPSGGREAQASFAFGGAGLLVADRFETAPYEEPLRVRALEVATGEPRWATELREDAATPRGVADLPAAGTVAVAWSDSQSYSLNYGGISILDSADGKVLEHGLVNWAHPDGDQLRLQTLTGPLVPGNGERVLFAGEPKSWSPSDLLQVAAYDARDGSFLWAREVDLEPVLPNQTVRIGAIVADPSGPWLWVSGTAAPPGINADGAPFVARIDAGNGSVDFGSTVNGAGTEASSGLALEYPDSLGHLDAALDGVILHATSVDIEGSDVRTAWVTAFSKADGAVRWSRVLDPVQGPILPFGLAVSAVNQSVAIYGARNVAPTSWNVLNKAASAATWLGLAAGDVLGDAEGSGTDGSRWIEGAVDGAGLILSEIRREPSQKAVQARLSRWSLDP